MPRLLMGLLRRFGRWLDRRGWGLRQAWFTGLAGIAVGYTTITTGAQSSGAERIVATAVGVLCALIGVAFAAAVIVLRREQPATPRTRVRDTSFRWPGRRGAGTGGSRFGSIGKAEPVVGDDPPVPIAGEGRRRSPDGDDGGGGDRGAGAEGHRPGAPRGDAGAEPREPGER